MAKNKLVIPFIIAASLLIPHQIYASGNFALTNEKEGEVLTQGLNVRSGPGMEYSVIKEAKRGEKMNILGKIQDWYLVQLASGNVGLVYSQYLKITQIEEVVTPQGDNYSYADISGEDAEVLFALTNRARMQSGLSPFIWDENLNNIARLKAEDMEKNNYFDHFSETYGTPFKMLKEMGIDYKGASENILSNMNMDSAHDMVMGSPAHRSNILSSRYNKMGIGIAESKRYGKIIVQMFIEE